jgi:hypothetical protein
MNAMQYFYYLRRREGYSRRQAWISTLAHYCADMDELNTRYMRVINRDKADHMRQWGFVR